MTAISGAKNVTSALIISPDEEFWGPIQKIREKHDKAFIRWMPHINLLYPFVPEKEFQTAFDKIENLQLRAFTIRFDGMGCFKHGKNATVFLKPTIVEANTNSNPLVELQQRLESVFPHCDDLSHRSEEGFQPHLTIAQFPSAQVDKKIQELMKTWTPFTWHVNKLYLIARPPGSTGNEKFAIKKTVTLLEQAIAPPVIDEEYFGHEWVGVPSESEDQWNEWEEVPAEPEPVKEEEEEEESIWAWEGENGTIAVETGNNNQPIEDWTAVQPEDNNWGWVNPEVEEQQPQLEEDNSKYIATQSSLTGEFDLSLVNMGQHSYNELFVEAPPVEEVPKPIQRSALYDYAPEEERRELDIAHRDRVLNSWCRVRPSDSKPKKGHKFEPSTKYWTKRTCNVCGKLVFEFNQKHAKSDKYLPWKELIHIHKHKYHIHNDGKSLEALLSLAMNVAKMQKKRRSAKTFELVVDWIKADDWPMFEVFQTELNKRLNASEARRSYMVREKANVMKKRQVNALADKMAKSKSSKGDFKMVNQTTIKEDSDWFDE